MTIRNMTSISLLPSRGSRTCAARARKERAQTIIENCVQLQNILWDYLKLSDGKAQTPQSIRAALGMHAELAHEECR